MNRRLQVSFFNALSRYPFRRNPKPTSSSIASSSSSISPSISSSSPELSITPTSTSNSRSYSQTHFNFITQKHNVMRNYSSGSGNSGPVLDQNKEVDMINLKFAEAREEIEMALESKETVYFDEEAEFARAAVAEVLKMFDELLGRLPESERAALQRSMGLKIEELKVEHKQLDE